MRAWRRFEVTYSATIATSSSLQLLQATSHKPQLTSYTSQAGLEKIEVRSFGYLLLDLLSWFEADAHVGDDDVRERLRALAGECVAPSLAAVPSFATLSYKLLLAAPPVD